MQQELRLPLALASIGVVADVISIATFAGGSAFAVTAAQPSSLLGNAVVLTLALYSTVAMTFLVLSFAYSRRKGIRGLDFPYTADLIIYVVLVAALCWVPLFVLWSISQFGNQLLDHRSAATEATIVGSMLGVAASVLGAVALHRLTNPSPTES